MISQDDLIETLYQANGESREQAVTRIRNAADSLGLTAFNITYSSDGAIGLHWTEDAADEICLAIFGVGSTFSYTDVVAMLLDEGYAKDDVDTAIDADSPVDGVSTIQPCRPDCFADAATNLGGRDCGHHFRK